MRTRDDGVVRIAIRFARAGSRLLLPGRFRRRHGAEAEALFARLAGDAWMRGGLAALILVVVRAQFDVLIIALREWRDAWSRSDSRQERRGRTSLAGMADVHHAARALRRRPGLSATVIGTLGIAMGAVTAVVCVADGVLLRPLPYENPDALHLLVTTYTGKASPWVSWDDFLDYRSGTTRFEKSALTGGWTAVLTGDGEPSRETGMRITDDLFELLGVRVLLGRTFTAEEQRWGEDRVVILGHGLWQRRYGGDPGVVGREIEIGGEPHTVVGVLGERFGGGLPGIGNAEIWKPFGYDGAPADVLPGRGNEAFRGVIRLAEGASAAQAEEELAVVAADVARRFPDSNEGQGVVLRGVREVTVAEARPVLLVFLAAVTFVLLIAVANVSSVTLARGRDRQSEFALRMALGADRRHLLVLVAAESLVLALAGGVLGVVLASGGTRWLVRDWAHVIPLASEIRLDTRILLVAFVITVACGLTIGLVTAAARPGHGGLAPLRLQGRGIAGGPKRRLRDGLIVAQIALTLLLASGAALLVRSFWSLARVEPGFDRAAITFGLDLPGGYYTDRAQFDAFYNDLIARVSSLPGVVAAGTVTQPPLTGDGACGTLHAEGEPDRFRGQDMCAEVRAATAGYFEAMRIPLREGRMFTAADDADAADVVIISETTARLLWPGMSALGRRLNTGFGITHEVVGVVADVKQYGMASEPPPQTYLPAPQWSQRSRTVVVLADAPHEALFGGLRTIVRELDARVPISAFRSMDDYVHASLATPRLRTVLLTTFAGVALLLTIVGVYGTLSHLVNGRRRELAIRKSVGAQQSAVLGLVLGEGLRLALPGVIIGIAATLLTTRALRGLLFAVSPTDPAVLASATLCVLAAAVLACLIPAVRATRVDPMRVLRED